MPRIILASASPQRKALLSNLGIVFEVIPSSVHEEGHPELSPRPRSQELAVLKARDIAKTHPDAWVIGCDTLVVAADGTLLEKPKDEADARRMLQLLSGNLCAVHSGLCVIAPGGKEYADISSNLVGFKTLTKDDMDWWIASKLWHGRSGGFQIDGPGQLFINHLEGDFTSVVGLPVYLLGELFARSGISLPSL